MGPSLPLTLSKLKSKTTPLTAAAWATAAGTTPPVTVTAL
jgi:hypothetical protein